MLQQASDLISQFRIFTMEDRYEKGDPVLGSGLGMIYPSSLLYVISGVLEEREGDAYVDAPILGMHRFLSRDPGWIAEEPEREALLAVRAYVDGVQHAVVYSVVSGSPGLSSSASSHGGFDEDTDTLRSIGSMFWPG